MKKISILFLGVMVFIFINTVEINANEISNINNEEEVILRTTRDEFRWVYQKVNGREQRRLRNFSRGEWVGKWEWV